MANKFDLISFEISYRSPVFIWLCAVDISLHTEADRTDVSSSCSEIDGLSNCDHKFDDVLPVVL